jgi:DedD protein
MDRSVKERLVGATILGLFVVLIVPELLSGPKRAIEVPQGSPPGAAEPIRTVIVDLATSKATATDDAAAAPAAAEGAAAAGAAGDPPDAAPAAALGQAEQTAPSLPPAAPQATAPPQPDATPKQTATPQPTATPPDAGAISSTTAQHGWQAQLGSFAARANAERLEQQVRAEGFSPSISAVGAGPSARYRVRLGPVADRAAVDRLVAKLKQAGHPATVVAP